MTVRIEPNLKKSKYEKIEKGDRGFYHARGAQSGDGQFVVIVIVLVEQIWIKKNKKITASNKSTTYNEDYFI